MIRSFHSPDGGGCDDCDVVTDGGDGCNVVTDCGGDEYEVVTVNKLS